MTEVTFYLSNKAGDGVRQALAWRIADKALKQGRLVYIHCQNEAHARELDDAFWHTPKTGFLPHAVHQDSPAPVILGHGSDPGDHHDVLINLTDQVPDFASRFQRVAEMISGEENERQAGRQRFRFYRERGFPVTTHELG
ncbi:DNA polymerase III subunit chi [Alcanivorax nanhaiticus]|uniref:DNA polymerase III subunit chi n=1 Tax=Alcanivorax nanhaiticus TaxID=1177154 RepID=A0A095SLZ1_9GAMM|nr:DNA polymerase III subunit chi [Alcanivorax nanhaiticus]KGD65572.1 DNA polymerase III subunit chi [Alcanivorax nanhaiticus]